MVIFFGYRPTFRHADAFSVSFSGIFVKKEATSKITKIHYSNPIHLFLHQICVVDVILCLLRFHPMSGQYSRGCVADFDTLASADRITLDFQWTL